MTLGSIFGLRIGRGLSVLCKRNGKNTGHLHNLKDDEQFCEVFVCPLNFVNYCMKQKSKNQNKQNKNQFPVSSLSKASSFTEL